MFNNIIYYYAVNQSILVFCVLINLQINYINIKKYETNSLLDYYMNTINQNRYFKF